MTKEEIIKQTTWDEDGIGSMAVFVKLFEKELPVSLFAEDYSDPQVSDKMVEALNDVINLSLEELPKVKQLLWEECLFSFQVADYGVTQMEGETLLAAQLREFEISNEEDAFSKSRIETIQVHYENDEFAGRYAEIKVESAANNYISLIVKDGHIVDFDDDGTHLGWFDEDPQYAKKKRDKFLIE